MTSPRHKIKLLYLAEEQTNLVCARPLFKSIIENYFDFVAYDSDVTYDPCNTILLVHTLNKSRWWRSLYQQGFKLIVDNLSEAPGALDTFWIPTTDPRVNDHNPIPDNALVLLCKNYFWYTDSLLWYDLYHNYKPNPTHQYRALVPMARKKPHRTQLLEMLNPVIDHCLWSYVECGTTLPNDSPHDEYLLWHRHINPAWFNSTDFSIVAESITSGTWEFVTEKTFKAMAFYHPFLILGVPGSLTYLHSQGFETWGDTWNESYDTVQSVEGRIKIIVDNLINYNKNQFQTPNNQEKLRYNHDRFFNQSHVKQNIIKEIINPIIEYAEA